MGRAPPLLGGSDGARTGRTQTTEGSDQSYLGVREVLVLPVQNSSAPVGAGT